ncbi:MAG: trigger factor [Actinomycetota bacterium]|nr:trigger factor [Actinomycetota bacterium]
MKTTLTRESPTTVRLTIEATSDEISPAADRAFQKLAGEVKVPGFRKGKVPKQVLAARLGKETIREATIREAIPSLYAQAVVEENLEPIAPPRIEVTSEDDADGLAFDATIEVRPEIQLPDYTGLVVSRPSDTVTDAELEDQLKRLQERFATLETVSRETRTGDYVLMNMRTYVHDRQVDQATGTDILYELGAGGLTPDLDTNLAGKRAGEIVKFNTTLTENFGDFANQEVTCEVLVKEVRVKVAPALDDEFAKTASEFDTVDELKKDLREKMGAVKRATVDGEVRSRVLETLVTASDFEVPASLTEEEFSFRLERFAEQLRGVGLGVDDYLSQTQQTEEQVETDLRAQAERNVRAQLLLEEIGKAEGIEATQEELEDEVRRHAEALRGDAAELRKQLESKGRLGALAGDIIRRKALDFVTERAEINYEDPAEAPQTPQNPGAAEGEE